MTKARKAPGKLRSEADERATWEREDSTANLDWRRAERVRLPNLQPSTTAISIRLPVSDQDRRPQARRALSVADQDVAYCEGGAGRVSHINARGPSVAAGISSATWRGATSGGPTAGPSRRGDRRS
jgi:hypothetical protein